MTRITTAQIYEAGVDSMQTRQRELYEAQTRLTSGKRVSRPSDDPAAAAAAERAKIATARDTANQRAVDASRSAMTLAEAALGDAGDTLQSARETMVSAGNGSWTASERATAAAQLKSYRDQLLAIANRQDGNGNYLFAGSGSTSQPFVDGSGGVSWQGSAGTNKTASDEAMPLSVDGQSAWLQARSGNGVFETAAATSTGSAWIDAGQVTDPSAVTGDSYALNFTVDAGGATTYSVTRNGAATSLTNVAYSAGKAITIDGLSMTVSGTPANGDSFTASPSQGNLSPFQALDRAIAVLGNASSTGSQVTQAVKFGLRDIDATMSTLNAKRSDTGTWLNRIDDVESRNADAKLQAQTEQSNAEDLDIVSATSDMQAKQTSYDAALKTYTMVQKLSLFNYLGS